MLENPLAVLNWQPWLSPTLLIAGGLLLGWALETILISAICKVVDHTSLELNQNLIRLIRGVIMWIFALSGLNLATYEMPYVSENSMLIARKVLFVLTMLMAIRLTAQIAVAVVRFYLNRTESARALPNTSIFENIIRVGVFLLGILMLLQTLGVSVMPIITALGVGGLAISLALQDTLANLFAGIQMLMARQIRVGDTIQLENGMAGVVDDISWRTTRLRQLSGNLVILPNNKLSASIITNFATPHPDLTISLLLSVSLDSDLAQMEAVAAEAGTEVARRLFKEKFPKKHVSDVEAIVRYQSYGESWLNMQVSISFSKPMDGALVRHELIKAIQARLKEQGIRQPLPQQILHLEKPESSVSEVSRKKQSAG
jgi:small-conductance mechanosensitive channel